jgi:hypothetical protein
MFLCQLAVIKIPDSQNEFDLLMFTEIISIIGREDV